MEVAIMGGGAAGKISYPEYISIAHGQLLNHDADDEPDRSIVQVLNDTILNNPFIGEMAFNPDDELERAYTAITTMRTLVNAIDPTGDYSTALLAMSASVDQVINDDYITGPVPTISIDDSTLDADTTAFAAIQTQLLENTVLPPWKAGMHNINAVTSSAFVIGEAIIRAMNQQDIAKYSSGVRTQIVAKNAEFNADFLKQREDSKVKFNVQRNEMIRSITDVTMNMLMQSIAFNNELTMRGIQYAQVHIASKFDEKESELLIEESEAKWEMDLFQPVASFIGAMSSGGGVGAPKKPSRAVSVISSTIGTAATGASIGASVAAGTAAGSSGGIYGAAIGAVVGLGLGLATS